MDDDYSILQAKIFKSDVFPAPDAPMIAVTLPCEIIPVTSLSIYFCIGGNLLKIVDC
jgi:hypothetical protein